MCNFIFNKLSEVNKVEPIKVRTFVARPVSGFVFRHIMTPSIQSLVT